LPRVSNDSDEEVYRKPRPNVYTVMLLVSLLAILFGTLLLYLHMQRYDFRLNGAPAVSFWHALGGDSWVTALPRAMRAFLLA